MCLDCCLSVERLVKRLACCRQPIEEIVDRRRRRCWYRQLGIHVYLVRQRPGTRLCSPLCSVLHRRDVVRPFVHRATLMRRAAGCSVLVWTDGSSYNHAIRRAVVQTTRNERLGIGGFGTVRLVVHILLGQWVKYNLNYLHLYPFLGTHLQVRRVDGFSRMMAQTTRTRAGMCLFGFRWYCYPFRG